MPNLPVVGKVPKGWVIVVAAGSVGAIGYVLWRRHQAGTTAAAATTTAAPAGTAGDPYPPDGSTGNPSDPNSTDPETGMTYGDEQLYGGGYGGTGLGAFGFPGGTTTGGGTTGGPVPGGGPPFSNNSAWFSFVQQALNGIVDPGALTAALGDYLTGSAASPDQVALIDQAIAAAGYPPVAGANGYPPNIKQGPGGPGGGGKIPVPNVVGQNWMGAIHQLQAAGFKPSPSAKPPGAHDPITSQSPAAGTQAAKGATVTIKGR